MPLPPGSRLGPYETVQPQAAPERDFQWLHTDPRWKALMAKVGLGD
jgi:hypothetical protein